MPPLRLARKARGITAVLLLMVSLATGCSRETPSVPADRPSQARWCFDYTDSLPPALVQRIDKEGEAVRRNLDVDFVIVLLPALDGQQVQPLAARLFSRWEIGKSTRGKKGVLILVARKEQQIKIEIGYDLEFIYTDAYVGQVEREFMQEFLAQGDWDRGLLATIENFLERLYRKEAVADVRDAQGPEEDMDYYSQGAGARTTFDFGSAAHAEKPETPEELRAYFSAQPTPRQAFERYMEKIALNIADHTLDLYSAQSKVFYSHWRTSSGQRRAEYEAARGKTYVVRQKGDYAVVMAPFSAAIDTVICQCPYFFVRSDRGWQIDINTMARSLMMGGPTWHFLSTAHPYMFAFEDYLLKRNRYYPLRGQEAFLGLTYPLFHKGKGPFKISPEWDSPAKEAGIRDGDLLIAVDGVRITEPYQDWEMMENYLPGERIDVVVQRNGRMKTIPVELAAPTSWMDEFPYVREAGDPWTGFYFAYSQPYERKIEDVQLSVIDVVPGSPAEAAGFLPGDLIYTVPGSRDRHVGVYDYNRMLRQASPGDTVRLKVLRDLKKRIELELEIGSYATDRPGI